MALFSSVLISFAGSASPKSEIFDFAAVGKGDFPESKAILSITGSDAKETASGNKTKFNMSLT